MPTMPTVWDDWTLKEHEQAATEDADDARTEQDQERATIYAGRAYSDARKWFAFCPLPACRRARGCRGNPNICLPVEAGISGKMADAIERIYLHIQQQRRRAATLGRRLDMLDPVERKPRQVSTKLIHRRPGERRDP